jgi:hypothetical protein
MSLVYNPKMKTGLGLGAVRPNFHRKFFKPHPSLLKMTFAVRHFAVYFFNTAYRGEALECPPVET